MMQNNPHNIDPSDAESNNGVPSDAKPGDAKPNDGRPNDVRPSAPQGVDQTVSPAVAPGVQTLPPPPPYAPMYTQPLSRELQVRQWAMFVHLASLIGLVVPFGGLVGVLVMWQMKRQEFPEIDPHGKEAMNFQLSMMIYMFVSVLMIFIIVGILTTLILGLVWIILPIIGAVNANDGKLWRYPLVIPFFK
jgi:uncharacterized protein